MLEESQLVAPQTSTYSVAGHTLNLETVEEWTARAAESFLDGFYLKRHADPPPAQASCTISVRCGAPPSIPASFQSFDMQHGSGHTDGEVYYLDVNESRLVVGSPASRRVDVWIGDSRIARHPVAFINVMTYALHFAFRRCGITELHSGAVVEPRTGAGALLCGDSNSGKSTLTLRLACAGWRYLSDDMLLLSETGERVEARAFRRIFSISAESLVGCDLPELADALGDPVNSDPRKRRLDPSILFPAGWQESCQPCAIFFPRVAHEARTRVEQLSRSDAMLRLLKIYPWAFFDVDGASYRRLLERLVRQTRAYALHAGRDLLEDATLAPRVIAERLTAE